MTAREWVTLAVGFLTFVGTMTGIIVSTRANKRSRRSQSIVEEVKRSAQDLDWVRQAKAETQAAETKALQAETAADQANLRADRAERRLEQIERRLTEAEDRERQHAAEEVRQREIATRYTRWTVGVVKAAHDPTVTPETLRAMINGGPPKEPAEH